MGAEDERRYSRSRELLARASQWLPQGVSSPFRARAPVPLYIAEAAGCRITDVDGNEYLDYGLAWGPLILGHRHPRLVEAVRAQADRPHTLGAQHELEPLVAEQICRIVPCAERVCFTSSGTEAVQLALRLARAHTRRRLVLKFEGHYHGWVDTILLSHHPSVDAVGDPDDPAVVPESAGQVPNAAENVVVRRWNDVDTLEAAFRKHPGEIAAVVMEAVLCNSGCLLPREGYLGAVRDLCDTHGALLIFDEIITGFRVALPGAQGRYGVTPDLATFGKAIGGGLPLSVVTGRAEVMELVGRGVSFGGTFNGNPLSLAGAHATLTELEREGGAPLFEANRLGERLREGIQQRADARGIALRVTGFGAAFALHFTPRRELTHYRDTLDDDEAQLQRFMRLALSEGVSMVADGRFYMSVVHGKDDVRETLERVDSVLDQMGGESGR
ncbi:MAG: aspartate aminotransferase family protein [Acidobacteria bacterium]|jgi:glutamate-1-semialdehyde 2,1-aminomutase|nr:aspartate aminotransferase family protein [Acidobacteriota bacterium]